MICGALNRFGRAEQPCWSAPGGVTLPRCGSFQRETGRDNTHGQLVLGGTPPRLAVCPVQSENGRDNTHGLGCRSLYAPRDSNPEPADCSSQIIAPRAFLWTSLACIHMPSRHGTPANSLAREPSDTVVKPKATTLGG